jgi:alpha-tubulin suppressor-like RCC1 family protein
MKALLKFSLMPLLLHSLTGQAALTVTNIAPGFFASHSLFLKSDGSLWAMGQNGGGELGNGTYNQTNRPEQIIASNVTAIAAGSEYSLFLKSDGSLWAMGYKQYGQLGDGTVNDGTQSKTNRPEQIVASGVTAIAAGQYHSLFLKSDGSLWAMGYNHYGQLGDGTYISTNRPEQIVASGVTAIAAGDQHSLFLKSDGSLWAMGYNGEGQLGDGTTDSDNYQTNRPEEVVADGVTNIAAGAWHSLFLRTDGSLWVMGFNRYGQLGDGTYGNPLTDYSTNRPEEIVANGVTAIAAGADHSLFLKSDGSLWAMGDNTYGQLGEGTVNETNRPQQIVAGGVTAIAAGDGHSLFLKSDGSLWAVGYDFYGELGDGFPGTSPPYGTTIPEQILPMPQPVLTMRRLANGHLQFNATCGFGGYYYLLGTTNFSLPLS